MPDYRVQIEIDVDADTPLDAARDAAQILQEATQGWVVDVFELDSEQQPVGKPQRFDLDVDLDPDIKVEPVDERLPRRSSSQVPGPCEGLNQDDN